MPLIPGGQIQDGSISGGKLTVGTVVAGIVDGTLVQAEQYQQTNAFGAVLWLAYSDAAMFWYEDMGSATQGALIASSAHASGTDPLTSTAYPAGFAIYAGGTIQVIGSSGSDITMEVFAGSAYLLLKTGAAEESFPANLQAIIANPGASENMVLDVVGPKGTTYDDVAWVNLQSAPADGSANAGGNLVYTDTSAVVHSFLTWGSSGIQVRSANSGDANTYQTERVTCTMTGNSPVTVNTTSGQAIMHTLNLGVGTYHIHGQVIINPTQAASYAELWFTSGGTATGMRIVFQEVAISTATGPGAATTNGASFDVTAYGTGSTAIFTTTTFGTSDRCVTFNGTIVQATAGTFGLNAACPGAPTDTFKIYGFGCYMELNPIALA